MMNLLKYFTQKGISFLLLMGLTFHSCQDVLEIEPASQFSKDFIATKSGMRTVLNSAYDNFQFTSIPGSFKMLVAELTTDIALNFRGAANRDYRAFINFNVDPAHRLLIGSFWEKPYRAIRDANVILENLGNNVEMSQEERILFAAEARFIRATTYQSLYSWYGPVPLIRSSDDGFNLPRAEEAELVNFIENEYLDIIEDLPLQAEEYGRATQGAAMAFLTRFYLNNHEWQKAADMAQQFINLNEYALFPDYSEMFSMENEGNSEMIFVFPTIGRAGNGNIIPSQAFPPNYPTTLRNTGTQTTLSLDFYYSFASNDKRKETVLIEYVDTNGDTVNLLEGDEFKHPRPFKYAPDPNSEGQDHGVDIPVIRYADILLMRAEALNELNGPTQEAVDLVNLIRKRAGLENKLVSDFSSKEAMRDHILQERAWEFYLEGVRRDDLIRQGKFIENAQQRGMTHAQSFHVRFPLPQAEIDANPNLVQNNGY